MFYTDCTFFLSVISEFLRIKALKMQIGKDIEILYYHNFISITFLYLYFYIYYC